MIIINKETNKTYVFEEPNKIAYDGCHKIYICEDDEDLKKQKKLAIKSIILMNWKLYIINLAHSYLFTIGN